MTTDEVNCPEGAGCETHPMGHHRRPVDLGVATLESTTTTRTYRVEGAPPMAAGIRSILRFVPSRAVITFTNDALTDIVVTGPRFLDNGTATGPDASLRVYPTDTLPAEWLMSLVMTGPTG